MSSADNDDGPGAHVEPIVQWRFMLNKRDSLLVLKALGGRLATDEDRQAARELGNKLTLQRQASMRALMNGLNISAAAAEGDMKAQKGVPDAS